MVLSDAHERRLGEAADELAALAGGRPRTLCATSPSRSRCRRMVDGAIAAHGRIDVLVNNAGLGGTADLVDMTDEQWHKVLDITLTGTFRCTRAALRHMYAQGGGVIVNNASVLGWRAQAGQAHYAAAKAGVMALTRCAAIEAAPHGVRVNAVAPSLAMHPFLAKVTTDELLDELTAARGVRARRRAVGDRHRDRVPGQRLLHLHDRRGRVRLLAASLSRPCPPSSTSPRRRCDASPVGTHLGWTDWIDITQERVNLFADATGDHQWIHVDVDRATAESPFGGPIAHGYLTLALSNLFLPQLIEVPAASAGVNYGTGKVRFPSPVPVGSRVRGGAEIVGRRRDPRRRCRPRSRSPSRSRARTSPPA